MSGLVDAVSGDFNRALATFALMSVRLVMIMTVAPVFCPPQTPWALRAGISAALSAACLPAIVSTAPVFPEHSGLWLMALTGKEAAVGMLAGMLVAGPLWIAEAYGTLLDNERGAMTGGTFNPMVATPSPIGALLQVFTGFAVLSVVGVRGLLELIQATFDYWKPFDFGPSTSVIDQDFAIGIFNEVWRSALIYFLPLLAMLMMVEFGLAIISIYAPSLQAFQMAMPIKSFVGLVLLLLSLGSLHTTWVEEASTYYLRLVETMSR